MGVAHSTSATGVAFWIRVSPGARRAAVGGAHGDALRVAVQAPAIEGRANTACIEALALAFAVKRAAIGLEPGARGRRKRVSIAGEPAILAARLAALAAPT